MYVCKGWSPWGWRPCHMCICRRCRSCYSSVPSCPTTHPPPLTCHSFYGKPVCATLEGHTCRNNVRVKNDRRSGYTTLLLIKLTPGGLILVYNKAPNTQQYTECIPANIMYLQKCKKFTCKYILQVCKMQNILA